MATGSLPSTDRYTHGTEYTRCYANRGGVEEVDGHLFVAHHRDVVKAVKVRKGLEIRLVPRAPDFRFWHWVSSTGKDSHRCHGKRKYIRAPCMACPAVQEVGVRGTDSSLNQLFCATMQQANVGICSPDRLALQL